MIRALDSNIPIVAVSGLDRAQLAWPQGATAFLLYDEWLRVGSVVADALASPKTKSV